MMNDAAPYAQEDAITQFLKNYKITSYLKDVRSFSYSPEGDIGIFYRGLMTRVEDMGILGEFNRDITASLQGDNSDFQALLTENSTIAAYIHNALPLLKEEERLLGSTALTQSLAPRKKPAYSQSAIINILLENPEIALPHRQQPIDYNRYDRGLNDKVHVLRTELGALFLGAITKRELFTLFDTFSKDNKEGVDDFLTRNPQIGEYIHTHLPLIRQEKAIRDAYVLAEYMVSMPLMVIEPEILHDELIDNYFSSKERLCIHQFSNGLNAALQTDKTRQHYLDIKENLRQNNPHSNPVRLAYTELCTLTDEPRKHSHSIQRITKALARKKAEYFHAVINHPTDDFYELTVFLLENKAARTYINGNIDTLVSANNTLEDRFSRFQSIPTIQLLPQQINNAVITAAKASEIAGNLSETLLTPNGGHNEHNFLTCLLVDRETIAELLIDWHPSDQDAMHIISDKLNALDDLMKMNFYLASDSLEKNDGRLMVNFLQQNSILATLFEQNMALLLSVAGSYNAPLLYGLDDLEDEAPFAIPPSSFRTNNRRTPPKAELYDTVTDTISGTSHPTQLYNLLTSLATDPESIDNWITPLAGSNTKYAADKTMLNTVSSALRTDPAAAQAFTDAIGLLHSRNDESTIWSFLQQNQVITELLDQHLPLLTELSHAYYAHSNRAPIRTTSPEGMISDAAYLDKMIATVPRAPTTRF